MAEQARLVRFQRGAVSFFDVKREQSENTKAPDARLIRHPLRIWIQVAVTQVVLGLHPHLLYPVGAVCSSLTANDDDSQADE